MSKLASEQLRANEFQHIIDSSERILITSHISPDPDSIASSGLLAATLRMQFPDKHVAHVLEDGVPRQLSFLCGTSEIIRGSVLAQVQAGMPDTLIITDANRLERVSRQDAEAIAEHIGKYAVRVIIIDHHEQAGIMPCDLLIHRGSVAAAHDVYDLLDAYGWTLPSGGLETAAAGIYSDSGGFVYQSINPYMPTVAEMVARGVNFEVVKNQLERYSPLQLEVFAELLANLVVEQGYMYSYLSSRSEARFRETITASRGKADEIIEDIQGAKERFINQFGRTVEGAAWGFSVTPDFVTNGQYRVSLRSESGGRDVSAIARRLGGGGHKPAAGATVPAQNVEAAIIAVKNAIQN